MRKQQVRIDSKHSTGQEILLRVAQGLILGLLLCNIHMSDLFCCRISWHSQLSLSVRVFFHRHWFQPLTDIQTSIYNFPCEMTIAYFWSHHLYLPNSVRWDLSPYSVTIWLIVDWWCNVIFVCFDILVTTIRLGKLVGLSSHHNWWGKKYFRRRSKNTQN